MLERFVLNNSQYPSNSTILPSPGLQYTITLVKDLRSRGYNRNLGTGYTVAITDAQRKFMQYGWCLAVREEDYLHLSNKGEVFWSHTPLT